LKLFLVWDSEGIQESEDRVLEQIFESVDADSDDDSESSDTKKNKKRKHGKDGKKDKRNSSSDKSSDSSSGSGDKAHLFLIVALDFSEYV
jgi:Mg-chelatase subunit ChlI